MKNILNEKPSDVPYGRTKYILFRVKKEVKDKKVLNIGCGFGWFEYNMLSEAGHIWGIDVTTKDIEMAKQEVRSEKVTFEVADALSLPYADDSFDCIVSWDVIEHIPLNMEIKMLSELARVLKKGGTFYLSTPYKSFLGTFLDPAYWMIKHRHYTKEEICKLVDEIPTLRIDSLEVRGGVWDILGILNMYVAKWIFKRKLFCKRFFYKKIEQEYRCGGGINTLFVYGHKATD